MKIKLLIVLGVSSLFYSCENNVCVQNEKELSCADLDAYNTIKSIEAEINSSFDNPSLSLEENLQLRKDFVSYFELNHAQIFSADSVLQDYSFNPKMLIDMRREEIKYFEETIESRVWTKDFLSQLKIEKSIKDTILYEGNEKSSKLVLQITNNSDSLISGFQIFKNYIENDSLIPTNQATYFLFSRDQIIPNPSSDEQAILRPGSKVVLMFPVESDKIPDPVIGEVLFVNKKN